MEVRYMRTGKVVAEIWIEAIDGYDYGDGYGYNVEVTSLNGGSLWVGETKDNAIEFYYRTFSPAKDLIFTQNYARHILVVQEREVL